MNSKIIYLTIILLVVFMAGCSLNGGIISYYPVNEASWIRNAEPIEFEGQSWYPTDNVENLLDKEMLLMGTYKGVQFFTERRDIRPFRYLYTKFGENQFRAYEQNND